MTICEQWVDWCEVDDKQYGAEYVCVARSMCCEAK